MSWERFDKAVFTTPDLSACHTAPLYLSIFISLASLLLLTLPVFLIQLTGVLLVAFFKYLLCVPCVTGWISVCLRRGRIFYKCVHIWTLRHTEMWGLFVRSRKDTLTFPSISQGYKTSWYVRTAEPLFCAYSLSLDRRRQTMTCEEDAQLLWLDGSYPLYFIGLEELTYLNLQ